MAKPKYMPTGYQPFSQQSNQYQQSEMLRSKVCGYLKKKIADEEQETQQYQKLGTDIDNFDVRKYGYIPYLMDAQRAEIKWLKAIHDKMCVRY